MTAATSAGSAGEPCPSAPSGPRALVIRLGGIGDIVLATPALRLLARHDPRLRIDLLVQAGFRDAAAGLPYVASVHELDKRFDFGLPARLVRAARQIRRTRYELIVNLQPSVKTSWLCAFARAGRVLTFRKDMRVHPPGAGGVGGVRHAVDDFVKTLLPLPGFEARGYSRELEFFVPDAADRSVSRLLRERDAGRERSIVVVNATARRAVNRWPPARWGALIDALDALPEARRPLIVAIGGPLDRATVRAVRGASWSWPASVLDLSCRLSLKETGALLRRASLLVTADTGPMHIAAALGTSIVCLSGAADPQRTGPLTPASEVVIDRALACVPCRKRSCRYGREPRCMARLSVERVFAACRRALAPPGSATPLPMAALREASSTLR